MSDDFDTAVEITGVKSCHDLVVRKTIELLDLDTFWRPIADQGIVDLDG